MSAWDVAIVGAGAAGIASARRLADHGRRVLLVDALDRLGGRAWTVELAGMPCDLGCGWLHSAERNPWVGVAEAAGLAIERGPAAWLAQYRNLGFPAADQHEAAEALAAFNQRLRDDPPASDRAIDALDPGEPWTAHIEALSSYMNGAQLDELSVADYLAYDDAAGPLNWRLPGGYGALVTGAARGIETVLDTSVSAIDFDTAGVALSTPRGTIRARGAIVTVSTEVLARGAITLPARFTPVIEAASRLPLGLADKLFLRMAEPDALPPETHLLGNPHAAATGSYYIRPFGRPLIEVFLGGAAARALEDEGAAVDFACGELGGLLGSRFTTTLMPLAATQWAKLGSVGGSYSHALPGHAGARQVLATPVDERILIAGEACSAHDFSTAHGAWGSGVAAAELMDRQLG